MFELKTYQKDALAVLVQFLELCRSVPVPDAFHAVLATQNRADERYQSVFADVPCVCLRIPTGGGKTVLAAHAVALVGKAVLDSDAPVALWLTPSDTIRTQTLKALSDARHPYRQAMAQHFGDRVQICDLESLQTISPHDIGKSCVVVVATIQSFNVSDTAKRTVYSFFEELAPHFDNLPAHFSNDLEKVTEADVQNQPYLTVADIGRVKHSVANWFHLCQPVVIVDEAHNNRTNRFFKTLGRLNPCCVVELTATPVAGNNVLYHVSAQELKTEQMIKLPIVLAEHPEGWRECLRDAVLTRNSLEQTAQQETDYIRPIVLVQAAPKGNEATVDVVRQHLIEQEQIPENQIAVATGAQKELDGIDLFHRDCKICYIITVEALKEGWDCSFAYVLASLQSVNSSKDVEQLLGRVLRMPYAKTRQQEELNKAYAHIVAENFAQAAATLKDRMVQNMGFDRLETAAFFIPPPTQWKGLPGLKPVAPTIPDCHIEVPQAPNTQHWPEEIKAAVQIRPTTQGATILLQGDMDSAMLTQAEVLISKPLPEKARIAVKEQFDAHRAVRLALRAPAQLGMIFTPVPKLCLWQDDHFELVERETLSDLGDWDLLDHPVRLDGFAIRENIDSFEIDVNEQQVKYRHIDAKLLKLNDVASHISEQNLVRLLEDEVRQPYISQKAVQEYLARMLVYLIHDRGFALTALVRARFQLAQAIAKEIKRLRQHAMNAGFQARLFDMAAPTVKGMACSSFQFQPGQYPARQCYQGSYEFSKHYYSSIHDLREKTVAGETTEEFLCAQAIDAHPKVKQWVRNIERQEPFSFWLPTSTDYFYPDFIAELTDGRVLAVEYKGEIYKTNDDSQEKKQVGEQWEKSSGGCCLFLFAVAEDEAGRSMYQQLADKLT